MHSNNIIIMVSSGKMVREKEEESEFNYRNFIALLHKVKENLIQGEEKCLCFSLLAT